MSGIPGFSLWMQGVYAPTHPGYNPHDAGQARDAYAAYVKYNNDLGGKATLTADGNGIDDGAPKDAGTAGDIINAAGVVAGSLVGGPVGGLVAGAAIKAANDGVGQSPGASVGSAGATGGGGVNGTPGTGTTPNTAAWNAPGSQGYGSGFESAQTKALKAKLAQLQSSTTTTVTIQTPAGPQQIQVPVNNPDINKAIAAAQADLTHSQQSDSSASDTQRLADNARDVAGRAGPTIDTTKLNFSSAVPNEANAQAARDLQTQQIQALLAGKSAQGQQDYIDKLNGDLAGGAPSVAEQQLIQGRDVAESNAMSVANSATGPTRGLTQLEALRSAQGIGLQTNQQAAMLRAQEYAQTRDALGAALNQQRTAGIQEQSVASTGLTNMREGDIKVLADKYNNAVQQGLISSADARAKLQADLTQRGLNDTASEYYTTQYFGQQNRAQDTAIDAEKTRVNAALGVGSQALTQQQINNQASAQTWDKTKDIIGMGTSGVSAAGSALQQSGVGSGPGNGGNGGTGNGGTTYVNDTGHSEPITDEEAA